MWLPAAKKMKAREPIPRSDGPFVSIKKRKDQRWQVYVRLDDGRSATTTCKTQADAKDRAADFVAGVGVKMPSDKPAVTATRKSARGHATPGPCKARRVSSHYVPGPGRGHHTPVTRATIVLEALKKQLVLDFAEGVLSVECKEIDELFHHALGLVSLGCEKLSTDALFEATDTVIQRQQRE